MSLAREEEEYWVLRIVHDCRKAFEVCEEKVSTLISSKSTAETNHKSVRIDTLKERNYASWVSLILEPVLCKLLTDILNELLLESHTSFPDFRIRALVDAMPKFFV